MSWCPKCKNEYREGITICTDCNVELVDDLNAVENDETLYQTVFETEKKELAEKFAKYLEFSKITRYCINEDDDSMIYGVSVHADDYEAAKKLFVGFAITENSSMDSDEAGNDDSEENDDADVNTDSDDTTAYRTDDDGSGESADNEELEEFYLNPDEVINTEDIPFETPEVNINEANSPYIRQADKYKDYKFSAYTCIGFGALGTIYCIINIFKLIDAPVFRIFGNKFSQIAMLIMFLGFFVTGIYTFGKSKSIQNSIDEQEHLEKEVITWLEINVTRGYLDAIKDDGVSDEVNYFKYLESILRDIKIDIPNAPVNMIDALVDEHITKINY